MGLADCCSILANSMCRYCRPRSLHGGDPRAEKNDSTAIKNCKESSAAIQDKSYTSTVFSPLSSQRRPSCGGLSAEQAAIVRESREEYARRGGFVRIFPTEDSWELYG